MTVLSPSLPPPISTTTRTVSRPGSAARAVRARNSGTTPPRASSDEPCSARVRNWRRWSMAAPLCGLVIPGVSGQVVFRQRQDGVDRLADAAVQRRPQRLALADERDQPGAGRRADPAGEVVVDQDA